MSSDAILEVQRLTRTYASGGRALTVLDDVSFRLNRRETCAIVGPSGSGKTTLIGLCAGLDLPTSGSVTLNGTVPNAAEKRRAIELARGTSGVKSVKDNLKIGK